MRVATERRSIGLPALVAVLAFLLLGGCSGNEIIDCAGPGVNVDLRGLGSAQFPRSASVTGCAEGKCVTYRPGADGSTEHFLFVPLPALGVAPKAISVRVSKNGRTVFAAATHEQFSVHRGGPKCSTGLYFVSVDQAGEFHPSGP